MAVLLLLVSVCFAVIFGLFSYTQDSLEYFLKLPEGNFLSILFFVLGFFWFSYFFFIVGKDREDKKTASIDISKAKDRAISLFQDNLYYIGFIFLYSALYFIIGPSVGYDFGVFIFVLSFLILLLFFVSEKFSLFRDLIKINTILFSLYYIVSYCFIFITGNDFFGLLDLLNQIFILAFFVLNLYNDKTLLKNKINDNALIGYGFIYLLLFLVFYISKGGLSLWLGFTYIGTLVSLMLKNFITEVSFFKGSEAILKALSIVFGYVGLICAVIYFAAYGFNLFALIAGVYLTVDNIVIHNKFQNYISLLLGLSATLFFYGYFYFSILSFYEVGGYVFLLFGYLLYFGVISMGYLQELTYKQDYYFIYGFFYASSVFSMLYFLFSFRFELFDFGVMLLLQSIITFMVYYKFSELKKHDQQSHLS